MKTSNESRSPGDEFVWHFESPNAQLRQAQAPTLGWAERIGVFDEHGALRRYFALRVDEAICLPELSPAPKAIMQVALIGLDPDAAGSVNVVLSMVVNDARSPLILIPGSVLSSTDAYTIAIPLPSRRPLRLELAVDVARATTPSSESRPVVGLCQLIVGSAQDLGRLRGRSDYQWRLDNERRHSSRMSDVAQPHADGSAVASTPQTDASIDFVCNVCGASNRIRMAKLSREEGCCGTCRSTVRMRAMIHLLSIGLFRRSRSLPQFPVDKTIRGIGLSDWDGYAKPLARKFEYSNTYFHQEPRVDITAPPPEMVGTLDFIIATDVFEHVTPPVDKAFAGAAALLKPGGILVFSVPWGFDPETLEHFPNLYDFTIEKRDGQWTLTNRARDGRTEVFRDLVFHGGPGQVLEMRLFSLDGIQRQAAAAGFDQIDVLDTPVWEFGIHDPHPWSRPMLMRKRR